MASPNPRASGVRLKSPARSKNVLFEGLREAKTPSLAYLSTRAHQRRATGRGLDQSTGGHGIALVARVSYAVVLGKEFAWYLLGLTQAVAERAATSAEVEESGRAWRRKLI